MSNMHLFNSHSIHHEYVMTSVSYQLYVAMILDPNHMVTLTTR